jgi:hypothetical protein
LTKWRRRWRRRWRRCRCAIHVLGLDSILIRDVHEKILSMASWSSLYYMIEPKENRKVWFLWVWVWAAPQSRETLPRGHTHTGGKVSQGPGAVGTHNLQDFRS